MSPEEITSVVDEIRERVRARHAKTVDALPEFELPSLDPLGHARDAAEGKSSAIGRVNPRPPGLLNNLIQAVKKTVARALDWHVRDQVDFNHAAIRFMDKSIDAAAEQNQAILRVARGLAELNKCYARQMGDMLSHWNNWRPAIEEQLTQAEMRYLHSVREMESSARNREDSIRAAAREMHQDYLRALQRANDEIQTRFWADLEKIRTEQQQLIQTELRLIRRRAAQPAAAQPLVTAPRPAANGAPASTPTAIPAFDYARFEERFRGREQYVESTQEIYLDYFAAHGPVLDLGCGRGEFLALLSKNGVEARGVDADPDAIAACREQGLNVEQADLFEFLERQPGSSLGGVFCSHVVEHLPPARLPRLIALIGDKLSAGGVLAIETPNPNCLAIFAGDFFLDPTHVRPVPSRQLHFYFEECGFGRIEIRELHPASALHPELAALDGSAELRAFRDKFFGGLDYAIIGRKLQA